MLVEKSNNIKESIDEFWLMQTPERVENLPSPPYVTVRTEDFTDYKNNSKSQLIPPMSTLMALNPLYEIMKNSINLEF